MVSIEGKTRREVVACLIAAHAGGDAEHFSLFGPAAEADELKRAAGDFAEVPESERFKYIADRLSALVAKDEFTGLSEIHPAWLVEVLSRESPRIIGIILRYLPSRQARYIIQHLPKRIKHRLPQLIDSFAVPAPILKIIRNRFEKQFVSLCGLKDLDRFTFEHIVNLKIDDLEKLLKDVGIHELAMALKDVDKRSLNILFNRLSIDEARSLQQRIRSLSEVSALLVREAKYTVLEMNLAETEADDLLLDIGLSALARALSREDTGIFAVLKQKMEPRLGYTLKRYIDQKTNSNSLDIIEKRRQLILDRVKALSNAGSIDKNLAHYFEDDSKTKIFPVPFAESGAKPDGWQGDNGVVE